MSDTAFKTGDQVILVQPQHRGEAKVSEQTVGKVGRKYFQLDSDKFGIGREQFELATGLRKDDGYNNYRPQVWRPDDWREHVRRRTLLRLIRESGIRFKGFGEPKFSTDTLAKLLEVLNDAAPETADSKDLGHTRAN